MSETRRYLGVELAGAKNQKTAIATLEFYPKEKKIFLLDIFDRIAGHREDDGEPAHHHTLHHGPHGGAFGVTTTGDEALLELIEELTEDLSPKSVKMGVNVPLTLPPSLAPKTASSANVSVKWMREALKKAEKLAKQDPDAPRVLEFTTYTQRPIELWVRYGVLAGLPETHRFEIDETLGGNKAPLTARMNFLRRHLGSLPLIEAWPKLTVALLAYELEIPKRTVQNYRKLEQGIHAREEILETLTDRQGIFIYERDVRKLSQSLPAFDAFICAYTALLADSGRTAKAPKGFPKDSGWVEYPAL